MKTFIAVLFICVPVLADTNVIPVLTIGDRSFTNVTLRKVNPTTVMLHYDGGFGSAAITNLPEPFQSRFYDQSEIDSADKAARWRAQVKADNEKRLARERSEHRKEIIEEQSKETFKVRVESISVEGIRGFRIKEETIYGEYHAPHVDRMTRTGRFVGGGPTYGAGMGYRDVLGTQTTDLNPVFIINGPHNVTDGKIISIRAKKMAPRKIGSQTIEQWDAK